MVDSGVVLVDVGVVEVFVAGVVVVEAFVAGVDGVVVELGVGVDGVLGVAVFNLSLSPCNDLGPNLPSDLTPIKVCNCWVKVPVGAGVVGVVASGVVAAGVVGVVAAGVVGVVDAGVVGVVTPGIDSGSWSGPASFINCFLIAVLCRFKILFDSSSFKKYSFFIVLRF